MVSWLIGLALMHPAHATWTITATDPVTGEVGAAGATCGRWVWVISGVVPGSGVVVAQGDTSLDGRDEAIALLESGEAPQDILDAITAGDDGVEARQYAVAALSGEPAVFSGAELSDWAGSAIGDTFSVQGNLLADEAVVSDAFAAYTAAEADGLSMPERLLLALEAGAAQGGDSRCDPDKAAKSAFLIVASPDDDPDDPTVSIKVTDAMGDGSPVEELRDAWDSGERQIGCSSTGASGSGWLLALAAGLLALGTRRR